MTVGPLAKMMADYRRFARPSPSTGAAAALFAARSQARALQPAWKARGMAILAGGFGKAHWDAGCGAGLAAIS